MGYNSFTTKEDINTYFCGSFDNVGVGGKFTLGQITPGEGWNEWGEGDYIATLNEVGIQDAYYTWSEGDWYASDRWGAPSGDPINDTQLDINNGYLVYSFMGAPLTFSGAVAKGDCEMQVDEDHNAYSGNFTPAQLTIGDIVPGDDWNSWGYGDYIATLNDTGVQDHFYTYDNGDWYECNNFGEPFGDPVNTTVKFEPNTVLLTYSFLGATLNYPSPLK